MRGEGLSLVSYIHLNEFLTRHSRWAGVIWTCHALKAYYSDLGISMISMRKAVIGLRRHPTTGIMDYPKHLLVACWIIYVDVRLGGYLLTMRYSMGVSEYLLTYIYNLLLYIREEAVSVSPEGEVGCC